MMYIIPTSKRQRTVTPGRLLEKEATFDFLGNYVALRAGRLASTSLPQTVSLVRPIMPSPLLS